MPENTTQSVLFPSLFSKPVFATFDQPDSSSDGGAILLKGIDSQMHLSQRLAGCIQDARQQGKVQHSIHDLLRQRIYGMASNVRLLKPARRLMGKARMKSRSSGMTENVFGETLYTAKKWSHRRRVIIKAEVVRETGRKPRDNSRFVITNLQDKPPFSCHTPPLFSRAIPYPSLMV